MVLNFRRSTDGVRLFFPILRPSLTREVRSISSPPPLHSSLHLFTLSYFPGSSLSHCWTLGSPVLLRFYSLVMSTGFLWLRLLLGRQNEDENTQLDCLFILFPALHLGIRSSRCPSILSFECEWRSLFSRWPLSWTQSYFRPFV